MVGKVMVVAPWSLLLSPSSNAMVLLLPPLVVLVLVPVGGAAAPPPAPEALPGEVVLMDAAGPAPAAWGAVGVVPWLSSFIWMAGSSSSVALVLWGVSSGIGESVAGGQGQLEKL